MTHPPAPAPGNAPGNAPAPGISPRDPACRASSQAGATAAPRRLSGVIEPTRRISTSPRPGAVTPTPGTAGTAAMAPQGPPVPMRTPAPPVAVPDDPDPVVRVTAYLQSLGVGAAASERLVRCLEKRVDAEVTEPGKRTAAMIEALDRWFEALPEKLELPQHFDRVGFVAAMHLGRLLNQYPDCMEDAAGLIAELRQRLDGWPDGVLPNWERQAMHRQPLGELPGVLRGQFWSGTYRWVVPVGASTGRRFRRGRRAPAPGSTPGNTPGSAPAHPVLFVSPSGSAAGE